MQTLDALDLTELPGDAALYALRIQVVLELIIVDVLLLDIVVHFPV